MTKEERDRLRALCAKATPGPWCELGISRVLRMADKTGFEACDREEWDTPEHGEHPSYYGDDPALIASARTAIPSLLTTLDEYEEENARLREALGEYGEHAIKCLYRIDAYRGALNPRGCDCGYDAALQGPRVKP